MPNNTAGTTGQILTSAGAGVAPTWTTPAGSIKGRVACAGTATQVISNTNVTATATILVTYEDSGDLIYTTIRSRTAGASFTVQFSSIPSTSGFINFTILP
jgi:hypothetical protein